MRKYKRPEVQTIKVQELNERVFLAHSGYDEVWDDGKCFFWWEHQISQESAFGRPTQIYDIGCTHACQTMHVPDHYNRGQHFVFTLNKRVPQNAIITCDSMTGQGIISDNGRKVLFYRPIMNNPNIDSIGISSLTINFSNLAPEELKGLGVVGWSVNDVGERYDNLNPSDEDYY